MSLSSLTFLAVIMALTGGSLWLLAGPLLRARPEPVSRRAADLAVYRHQLAELDLERAEGRLSIAAFEAARAEIGRRLLAAAGSDDPRDAAPDKRHPAFAVALSLAVAIGAGLLYGTVGAPGLVDMPGRAENEAAAAMTEAERGQFIERMVERLADRLAREPGDLEGWRRLGQAYRVLGRPREAARAYGRAVALAPESIADRLAEAEMLLGAAPAEGRLPHEAIAAYRRILDMAPDNEVALYFVGLAEIGEGRLAVGRRLWGRILALSDPGSPLYAAVEAQLDALPPARPEARPPDREAAQGATPGPGAGGP